MAVLPNANGGTPHMAYVLGKAVPWHLTTSR